MIHLKLSRKSLTRLEESHEKPVVLAGFIFHSGEGTLVVSRENSADIVTRQTTSRVRCLSGSGDFSLFKNRPYWTWGKSSLLWVAEALSPATNLPESEANHSPPSSTGIKDECY